MIELLERLNESFAAVSERIEGLDGRLASLEDTVGSFRGLSEFAESLTQDGWFENSFAEKIGDKFNEGLGEKLDEVTEKLGEIAESVSDLPEKIASASEDICDKLDVIDTSISNIDVSGD